MFKWILRGVHWKYYSLTLETINLGHSWTHFTKIPTGFRNLYIWIVLNIQSSWFGFNPYTLVFDKNPLWRPLEIQFHHLRSNKFGALKNTFPINTNRIVFDKKYEWVTFVQCTWWECPLVTTYNLQRKEVFIWGLNCSKKMNKTIIW